MRKNTVIRQAHPDDLETLVSFTQAIHLQEDDQSIPTHENFSTNLKSWLQSELDNSLSLFLICEIDNCPVGFIGASTLINDNGFLRNPTKGVINFIWIETKFRRKSLANQLVAMVEKCFYENGVKVIECSFTKKNQLANEFWNRTGYQVQSLTARKILTND